MTELHTTSMRSSTVGAVTPADDGRHVRLTGWVHRARDLGSLVFFDLRDRTGRIQVSFDPEWATDDVLERARTLGSEFVVAVKGTVHQRPESAKKGERTEDLMEIRATALEVLSAAEALPIPVHRNPDEEPPSEERRLRYRYLDLRRPEIQRNFVLRHRLVQAVRSHLSGHGFMEIETPLLTKRTPEGARDYLVPSRVHPGEFYALPQSPQLYKQLLMIAGMDRYFQIARCLRDEDLRADRQPEFTQIDIEMSFAGSEDVLEMCERMLLAVWSDVVERPVTAPFPRMTHREALARYGTDKPDLRIRLEIVDLTEILQESEFRVFSGTKGTTERIRGFRVPGGAALSRRDLDSLQEVARAGGSPGTLWLKRTEEGYSGPASKAITREVEGPFLEHAAMQPGDLFLFVVGSFRSAEGWTPGEPVLEGALDGLRREVGRLHPEVTVQADSWLWVTDFPLFEWDAGDDRLTAAHHPFTAPHPDDAEAVRRAAAEGADPATLVGLRSLAYDAVYNGHEIASGSVRIHDRGLQEAILSVLGVAPEEAEAKFGFLLEAFRYGAPPHAGIALGLDRLVMLVAGAASLRDVIAFPKTTAARALFERAPSPVDPEDLAALGLRPLGADTPAEPVST